MIAPLVFDRQRLRRNRLRARRYGHEHKALQHEATQHILERLQDIRRPFNTVLDMGSPDAALASSLLQANPERTVIHASTLPPEDMPHGVACVALDEEVLPFADSSFDLVIANMNLHGVNDVPGTLAQIRRCLKPDGLLLAALIGGETLREFRQCLADAELMLRDGMSPRLFPLIDVRDAGMLLMRAGFSLPVVDRTRITFSYADVFQLMHDLRAMGEGNALHGRDRRYPGRNFFAAAGQLYRERFGDSEGRIPAVFDLLFMAGWAADASQQKPLKPGAATQRLADALNSREIGARESVTGTKV